MASEVQGRSVSSPENTQTGSRIIIADDLGDVARNMRDAVSGAVADQSLLLARQITHFATQFAKTELGVSFVKPCDDTIMDYADGMRRNLFRASRLWGQALSVYSLTIRSQLIGVGMLPADDVDKFTLEMEQNGIRWPKVIGDNLGLVTIDLRGWYGFEDVDGLPMANFMQFLSFYVERVVMAERLYLGGASYNVIEQTIRVVNAQGGGQ